MGWALVLDSQMRGDRYFGHMRLGTIADGFAAPADASAVVAAATSFLNSRNVDLIVANHSHCSWKQAFRQRGFLEGPSNYIFGASPKLASRIFAGSVSGEDIYINRGDGDGPINL